DSVTAFAFDVPNFDCTTESVTGKPSHCDSRSANATGISLTPSDSRACTGKSRTACPRSSAAKFGTQLRLARCATRTSAASASPVFAAEYCGCLLTAISSACSTTSGKSYRGTRNGFMISYVTGQTNEAPYFQLAHPASPQCRLTEINRNAAT